jgi:hypothetical protein
MIFQYIVLPPAGLLVLSTTAKRSQSQYTVHCHLPPA